METFVDKECPKTLGVVDEMQFRMVLLTSFKILQCTPTNLFCTQNHKGYIIMNSSPFEN